MAEHPAARPVRRIIITTIAAASAAGAIGGCAPAGQEPQSEESLKGVACFQGESGCTPATDWTPTTCMNIPPPTVASIAITPKGTVASLRSETKFVIPLMSRALTPGGVVSVQAPVANGDYGTLRTVQGEPAPAVMAAPPPPEPPNSSRGSAHRARLAQWDAARRNACARALAHVDERNRLTLVAVAAHIESGRGIGAVDDVVPMDQIVAAADELFALHPQMKKLGVITGLPISTPLPTIGFPGLQGSGWVATVAPGDSPGSDRVFGDRLTAYFADQGAHVSLIDEGVASPSNVIATLNPSQPSTESTTPDT